MQKFGWVIGIIIFITSCQVLPTSTPMATLAPTKTAIPATNTIEPTSTSIPPTLTPVPTLVNIDFEMPSAFAPFENQFPLSIITQTSGYLLRCAFDSAQIEFGSVRLSSELEMRAWTKCYFRTPDDRIDYVIVPIYIVNQKACKEFIPFYSESQDIGACSSGFTPHALEVVVPKWLKIVTGTDQTKVYIFGVGFGSALSNTDTSQVFFRSAINEITSSNLDKFASTGDTGVLIKVGTVSHYLPAYDYLYDMFK